MVSTSNKYMATGPTGARCQEWPCRLIAGSKLLLCSVLLCSALLCSARTKEKLRWQGPAAYIKVRPVLSSERVPHKKKEKRNCHTSNKYMATGPTGARCQEWPCRLIAGSKLLLCSGLLCSAGCVEKEAVVKSRQCRKGSNAEKSPV
jgi:hypothetical protein